jgi:hypothetical protein
MGMLKLEDKVSKCGTIPGNFSEKPVPVRMEVCVGSIDQLDFILSVAKVAKAPLVPSD